MDFSSLNGIGSGLNISGITIGGASVLAIIGGLAYAVIQCFFGYRLFKFMVALLGFIVFGYFGYQLGLPLSGGRQEVVFIAVILVGALGAFLAFKFYKVGVFLQCFIAGLIIGAIAGLCFGWSGASVMSLAVISGILLGIAGIKLIKPLIIASTAISGGMYIGTLLASLIHVNGSIGVILGIVFTVCGIGVQIYLDIRSAKLQEAKKLEKAEKHSKKRKGGSEEAEPAVIAEPPAAEAAAVDGTLAAPIEAVAEATAETVIDASVETLAVEASETSADTVADGVTETAKEE